VPVSRTNTRRYVATCLSCGWTTDVGSVRLVLSERLRHHLRVTGHTDTRRTEAMAKIKVNTPGELPEQDSGGRLSDYHDHLVVFANIASPVANDRGFGVRDETPCDVYVYADGQWQELGKAFPVFFKTVQSQLAEAGIGNALGGVLKHGTARNPREWAVVPADAAASKAALADFDPDTVGML